MINKNSYNNFIKNLNNKKVFLLEVFSTLIFQVFIAYIVLMYAEHKHLVYSMMHFIGIVLVTFIIIIAIGFVQSPFIKFILFTLFSSCIGLLLSYRLDMNNKEENEIAKKSFITTVGIFIYIVIFGFFLSFLGVKIPYQVGVGLFLALLILIIAIFILSISGKYPMYHKAIAGIVIFLFSCFIMYDTVQILDKDYYGDFISASLDYFLDIINLFSGLLNLN
jgi:FtsH-binding integral membrane protein